MGNKRQNLKQQLLQQSFQQSKNNNNREQKAFDISDIFNGKDDHKGLNLHFQNGAQKTSTPYRSNNRVNTLLKGSPYYKQAQIVETHHVLDQLREKKDKKSTFMGLEDDSKPSSITTAMTKATTVYDFQPSMSKKEVGAKTEKKRDEKKKGKKVISNDDISNCQAGQKRMSQQKLDEMEFMIKLSSSKIPVKQIRLTDKKTGLAYYFTLVEQKNLKGFVDSQIIRNCDLTKLEVEYDYDTDYEQTKHSKKMLLHEFTKAVEFFVEEDPLKLVENVKTKI